MTAGIRSMSGLALTLLISLSALSCEIHPLIEPGPDSTVRDHQPTLRWEASDDGKPFRVQIQSQYPESGMLESIDVIVEENHFRPTKPLAASRASVKVLISTGCQALGQDLVLSQEPAFFIDTGIGCPMPAAPTIRYQPDRLTLSWDAPPEAKHFESVRISPQGTEHSEATLEPNLEVVGLHNSQILQLRSVCSIGFSDWRRIALIPSQHR